MSVQGLTPAPVSGNAPPATGKPTAMPLRNAERSDATSIAAAEAAVTRPQLEEAIKHAQSFAGDNGINLDFSVDDSTGQTVVKVLDKATKEVIRQIPSEEMLAISRSLDRMQGLLVQQKA